MCCWDVFGEALESRSFGFHVPWTRAEPLGRQVEEMTRHDGRHSQKGQWLYGVVAAQLSPAIAAATASCLSRLVFVLNATQNPCRKLADPKPSPRSWNPRQDE